MAARLLAAAVTGATVSVASSSSIGRGSAGDEGRERSEGSLRPGDGSATTRPQLPMVWIEGGTAPKSRLSGLPGLPG
jgi:hypothetical protein